MWAVACLVITYTQEFTGGLEKNRKEDLQVQNVRYRVASHACSYENAKDTSGMAEMMAQGCRAQPGDAMDSRGPFWGSSQSLCRALEYYCSPSARSLVPIWIKQVHQSHCFGWLVLLPKGIKMFQQSHAPFLTLYSSFHRTRMCVEKRKLQQEKKKTISHPSCHHL